MDKVIEQPLSEKKLISSISTLVVLISFGMLFATLFMGYAALRLSSEVWPPMGMTDLNLTNPIVSTVVILLSSATYYLFETKSNKAFLFATGALSIGFLISQLLLWNGLASEGILASSGIFASIIYAFTWIHAAHIVLGVALIFWLTFTYKNTNLEQQTLRINNVGKFWHFLTIVWLVMFLTIFVI